MGITLTCESNQRSAICGLQTGICCGGCSPSSDLGRLELERQKKMELTGCTYGYGRFSYRSPGRSDAAGVVLSQSSPVMDAFSLGGRLFDRFEKDGF